MGNVYMTLPLNPSITSNTPNTSNLSKHSKHFKRVEHFESVRVLYELKEYNIKIEFNVSLMPQGVI